MHVGCIIQNEERPLAFGLLHPYSTLMIGSKDFLDNGVIRLQGRTYCRRGVGT